ncbi:MAG: hypothetical protein CL824_04680 [Crocinitomicaceae bacterium]|nr:hypothetical protein [Crocinitomicaceae bacterium]
MTIINGLKMNNKLSILLCWLIIGSVTFIPAIKIKEQLPSIQFIDLILPIVVITLYLNKHLITWKKLYTTILIFSGYILFDIVLNNLSSNTNSYFEIYKVLKFLIIILFFSCLPFNKYFNKVIYPIFYILIIFNTLHFFDFWDFNLIVEQYYNGGIHIKTFGLNSLGEPATKRLIGTIGNPNNNAILFLFFTVLLYSKKKKDYFLIFSIFLSLFFFFLCQSRTAIIALFAIIIIHLIIEFTNEKRTVLSIKNLIILSVCSLAFLFSNLINKPTYTMSMVKQNPTQSKSVQGRMEVWGDLLLMVKEKPIFGYGPNKNYFYQNKIYSESEYIMFIWRYGIVGLLAYILLLIYLFSVAYNQRLSAEGLLLLQSVVIIGITSLTNNPLSSREISILWGLIIGSFFYIKNHNFILDEK